MLRLGLAIILILLPAVAIAGEGLSLTVRDAYAFETPGTAMTGAGYLTIENVGPLPDRLIGVTADFPQVMVHRSEETDGVARMIHVDTVDIAPGQTVTFAPGGLHVMFMGLSGDPFEVGEEVPATLLFEQAGEVPVMFKVIARD